MNPVGVGLDLLLAALLVAALVVGARLSRKLKGLRDGQAEFVKSVGELDVAAVRAENGLQALRVATQETHDQLLVRIEAARALSARLDRATAEAEDACIRAEAAAVSARQMQAQAQAHIQAQAAQAAQAAHAAEVAAAATAFRRDLRLAPEPEPEPVVERRAEPVRSRPRAERADPVRRAAEPVATPPAASVEEEDASPLARFVARRTGIRP